MVNPTYQDLEKSQLDLTVAGTGDAIMMVEAGARFVPEAVLLDALQLAQEVNGEVVAQIRDIQAKVGKTKLPTPDPSPSAQAAAAAVKNASENESRTPSQGMEKRSSARPP